MSPQPLKRHTLNLCVAVMLAVVLTFSAAAEAEELEFSEGVIVAPSRMGKVEAKAVAVLQEEIETRTGIKLPLSDQWPEQDRAVIAIGLESQLADIAGPFADEVRKNLSDDAEGFRLAIRSRPRTAAMIIGKDARGVLYGVGQILRKMEWAAGSIRLSDQHDIVTAPRYPLRGHQLGYRPKTNAYDAWSPEQFDQYIRELALFGSNAIELIPPVSDDDLTSPHMKVPAMEMMVRMSTICDDYGMDVWIWYPNVGKDYTSAEGIERELAERDDVLRRLPRVDAILVPGGDPGNLHPDEFFPFMDRMAEVLARHHPNAKIWVSPQAMDPTREWLASFYRYVNQKPDWLGGVVFAPWVKTPIAKMRAVVDNEIKIRRYPDITHNVSSQYPVRDWDVALALTLHRESYNPRPVAMKIIHNAFDELAVGTITYSEGINDDVNKFVWGDQDWDPERSEMETLRDYARFFISAEFADDIAHGFLAQERNWEGPLAVNTQVDVTLAQWRRLEKSLPAASRETYRFEMGLLRAYYDAYTKRRLIREAELEARAMDVLRDAAAAGSLKSIDQAEAILRKAKEEPVAVDYRQKCEVLADSLFEKIRSQTMVKRHGAKHRTRGAFMDGIDEPLNDAPWLTTQFTKIRDLANESDRLEAIDAIVNRTDPGPGGFYDNMGGPGSHRRIVNNTPWEEDPGTLSTPRTAYSYRVNDPRYGVIPMAWKNQTGVIYETPLTLLYENLDPNGSYRVKVAYTGSRGKKIRLVADDSHEVHGVVETWNPPIQEYPIPREATQDGRLTLTWTCGDGERGSNLSEIWLIKERAR